MSRSCVEHIRRRVAHGSRNTQCSAAEERAYGTLRLLTLSTLRLPDLFLYAHVLQVFDEDPDVERVPPVIVAAVRTIASGALRLAHRALETHARNVGYETGAWVDRALEQAGAWLCCERRRRGAGAARSGATGGDRDHACDRGHGG